MTMTTTVKTAGPVCECCAIAVVNADTSGCEGNCQDGHVERLAEFGGLVAIVTDDEPQFAGVFRCAGCGDDSYGYAGHAEFID